MPLRDAWESESGEFTPWLAREENIQILGSALGLDLEVEAQERNVGPFRADILCKNTVDESWVLVENQLERTDHGHLGQLLTYAAGLKAVTIVWISPRFTEEHRATLDWLNEITDENFNFFGVEVQLFQIDDSPVAPHFSVISKPNDWSKTVKQIGFWPALEDKAASARLLDETPRACRAAGNIPQVPNAEAEELDYPQHGARTLLDGRDDESRSVRKLSRAHHAARQ